MKELLFGVALVFAILPAECQESTSADPQQQAQTQTAHPGQDPSHLPEPSPDARPIPAEALPSENKPSAIKVKPGGEAIKNKDLWEKTGYIHPFVRMPRYILQDRKAIWTSPFHTAKSDIKWWAIFGAATGALIATDK